MKFSIIIAIYNRKEELIELLHSLTKQEDKSFEVLVIDDGSSVELQSTVDSYQNKLDIFYFQKENQGPGLSRNYGANKANGDYLLFLDSDCIVTSDYISNIKKELEKNYVICFGGADKAHKDFNDLQKAISYSMTSIFTTGGIRGKEKSVTKFQPRSFNMGIEKKVFTQIGGFSEMRIGEDPDLSLSLWEKGFQTRFFPSVEVYHKRRTSLSKFAKQVHEFGIARPILNQRHPDYTKIVFWFPTLFLLALDFSFCVFILSYFLEVQFALFLKLPLVFFGLYFLLLFLHSTFLHKSLKIGALSVITSATQLIAYGYGFLNSFIQLNIFKKTPKQAFPKHFY